MSDAPTLVTGLGAGVRAVLEDVPDLVAVVADWLIPVLGAVPGDVAPAVTPVTPLPLGPGPLLAPAALGKVSPALALVALEAPAPAVLPLPRILHLPPLPDPELPGPPGVPPRVPVLLVHVARVPLGAVPGKVARPVTPVPAELVTTPC